MRQSEIIPTHVIKTEMLKKEKTERATVLERREEIAGQSSRNLKGC